VVTVGYNVFKDRPTPFCKIENDTKGEEQRGASSAESNSSASKEIGCEIPDDCVILRTKAFSVNYADCCIRWGLYESANEFVGYPIVPGFDVAGVVERVGSRVRNLTVGDKVFGCTLFGAYSTRVLVPSSQLRRIPEGDPTTDDSVPPQPLLTCSQAASLPAVSLTALYALFLAGHYPSPTSSSNSNHQHHHRSVAPQFSNRSILIHSAAGGVGSLLVQMSRLLGLNPVVGVVGRSSKVDEAYRLGCHAVVDKSAYRTRSELWQGIRLAAAAPRDERRADLGTTAGKEFRGYSAIMDANGAETLSESYQHLAMAGRLVVFGFHTNLPLGRDSLNPWEWIKMAARMTGMPRIDPMDLVTSNKSVLGFNLSFFAEERDALAALFDQVVEWVSSGSLECPRIVEMRMDRVADAHEHLQSGISVGKIVLLAPEDIYDDEEEE
jgi:NADPH:quinone reductase-like Zn-dependent oxidoreductase